MHLYPQMVLNLRPINQEEYLESYFSNMTISTPQVFGIVTLPPLCLGTILTYLIVQF